jgi:hypothetical protein
MDRTGTRSRWVTAWSWLLLLALLPACGCTAVATAYYVIKGTNVDAEFKGLRDKRVVVVCRPVAELSYRNSGVADQLADQIAMRLGAHVHKIDLVDPREVQNWTDENAWDEFTEVGEALDADIVVAIDLEEFSLYESQTLYRGKATSAIHIFDMRADGREIWSKHPPQSLYPPNASVDTGEMREPEFRNVFIDSLAEEIARHFYDHDSRVDFASDVQTLR